MIEITVLGSSGSAPAKGRHMPAVALKREGDIFLFDCGEGTQMQMIEYGLNSYKTKAIFISHAHGDHIIGVAGLIRTLALNNRREKLLIFVPEGQERIVRSLIQFDKAIVGYEVEVKGVGSGIVYRGKGFSVSAFRLDHTIKALGYVFKEDDRRNFIKEKSARLGLKGEMFRELQKKGWIKVKGRRISLNSITTLRPGRKVVYAADTRPLKATIIAAKGADILMHESSYTEDVRNLAVSRKHSTAKEAAMVARKAGAKRLVLLHISTRYKTSAPLIKEASRIFKDAVVAKDGYTIQI